MAQSYGTCGGMRPQVRNVGNFRPSGIISGAVLGKIGRVG